jgi:hypothetical protein
MPPKLGGEDLKRQHTMMTSSMLRQIDVWRAHQDDVPSRSEAIRRLIEAGLEATSKKSGRRRD